MVVLLIGTLVWFSGVEPWQRWQEQQRMGILADRLIQIVSWADTRSLIQGAPVYVCLVDAGGNCAWAGERMRIFEKTGTAMQVWRDVPLTRYPEQIQWHGMHQVMAFVPDREHACLNGHWVWRGQAGSAGGKTHRLVVVNRIGRARHVYPGSGSHDQALTKEGIPMGNRGSNG